jgi:hypothetical protein
MKTKFIAIERSNEASEYWVHVLELTDDDYEELLDDFTVVVPHSGEPAFVTWSHRDNRDAEIVAEAMSKLHELPDYMERQ